MSDERKLVVSEGDLAVLAYAAKAAIALGKPLVNVTVESMLGLGFGELVSSGDLATYAATPDENKPTVVCPVRASDLLSKLESASPVGVE